MKSILRAFAFAALALFPSIAWATCPSSVALTTGSGSQNFSTASDAAGNCVFNTVLNLGLNPTPQALTWSSGTDNFSAGQDVGGIVSFTVPSQGRITGIHLSDASAQTAGAVQSTFDVIVFSANPSSSTFTNNVQYSLASADMNKRLATISLDCAITGVSAGLGSGVIGGCDAAYPLDYNLGSGNTTIYLAFISDGPRANANTDLTAWPSLY